jgi:hypothetical protein
MAGEKIGGGKLSVVSGIGRGDSQNVIFYVRKKMVCIKLGQRKGMETEKSEQSFSASSEHG